MTIRDAYVAIADPTRRQILDLLNEKGTLPAGEIAGLFEQTSRPGISRHLRILRECGVVSTRKRGKAQLYTIEKSPLLHISNDWLAGFAERQMESLQRLRRRVEKHS